jgi:hypothetical protein
MHTNVKLPKFDTLVSLYKQDPAAYDDFRLKLLNDEVEAAPPERRPALRRTLYKIEVARKKSKSPLEAAIMAYLMLCESTSQLRAEISKLHYLASSMEAALIIEHIQLQSKNVLR